MYSYYKSYRYASYRTINAIAMVTQCEIINNTTTSNGGGIYKCTYTGNIDITTVL